MTIRDRSTPDLIMLFLSVVVGFVVVLGTCVAVGGVIVGRGSEVTEMLKTVASLSQSLVAVILGYVAGRNAPEGKPR